MIKQHVLDLSLQNSQHQTCSVFMGLLNLAQFRAFKPTAQHPPCSSSLLIISVHCVTACIVAVYKQSTCNRYPRDFQWGCLAASCAVVQTFLLDICSGPLGLGGCANKQDHCKTLPLVLLVGTSAKTQGSLQISSKRVWMTKPLAATRPFFLLLDSKIS